jgi:hypothetical protein
MIVNQHHLIHNLNKEKQYILKQDSLIRAPNSFYLFKAKSHNEGHGQPISFQQLIEEWTTMSKDQRANLKANQSYGFIFSTSRTQHSFSLILDDFLSKIEKKN